MNGALYCEFFGEKLLPSVRELKIERGWVFQYDNDLKYTAGQIRRGLLKKHFTLDTLDSFQP